MSVVQEIDPAYGTSAFKEPSADLPPRHQRVHPQERPGRRALRQPRNSLLERDNARLAHSARRMLQRWLARGRELRRLRAVSALQSRALRRVNHECRSPLHSIFGLTELLRREAPGNLTAEQEQLVRMIRKAAESLAELLNDLTDPERLDAAQMALRPAQFDAAELLATLEAMLPPPLIKDGVRLIIEKPEAIPSLYSDPGKVGQILRNLVNNALKFTERGEVRVTVAHDAMRDTVLFSVHDTGPGIHHDQQKRLAGPRSARRSLAQGAQGSGLGLPLCHALAEILGGRISLTSVPGRGSTFSLVLPLPRAPTAADRECPGAPIPSRLAAGPREIHEER